MCLLLRFYIAHLYIIIKTESFRGKQFIDSEGHTTDLMDWKWIFVNELRNLHGLMPQNQAAAIMMLKDLGIMVGDGAGHISPLGNVTRAEIFKLLNECCKATKDYKKHKFLGWENYGRDFYTDSEIKALPWVYSLDQVINPEAEEKYQYTFGDLKWYDTTQAYYKSEQHSVMSGQHNPWHISEIYQKSLSEEYAKAVLDEVKNSYSREGNIIKFYLPDLKSKYHYIDVVFSTGKGNLFFNSIDNPGWNEIDLSNISLGDTEWCEMGIVLTGNGRYMPGESYYRVDINYVTGNIETREE